MNHKLITRTVSKIGKIITVSFIAVSMCSGSAAPVYANDGENDTVIIDYRDTDNSQSSTVIPIRHKIVKSEEKGSIWMNLASDETDIDKSGVTFSVSRIADANYALTNGYENLDIDLQQLDTAEKTADAIKLFESNYQTASKVDEVTTDTDGKAKVSNLLQGVYLVKAEYTGNFSHIDSFLVSIPSFYGSSGTDSKSEEAIYDVYVLPKYEITKDSTESSKSQNKKDSAAVSNSSANKNAPSTVADIRTKQYMIIGLLLIAAGAVLVMIQKISKRNAFNKKPV